MLKQYKVLIDDGYSMSLKEALAWEEAQSIESARQATGEAIEERRHTILARGRSETNG